jgi:hypothetical protein
MKLKNLVSCTFSKLRLNLFYFIVLCFKSILVVDPKLRLGADCMGLGWDCSSSSSQYSSSSTTFSLGNGVVESYYAGLSLFGKDEDVSIKLARRPPP